MNKVEDIEELILDISDNPDTLESRFNELLNLIKSSKGNINGVVLNDPELTELVLKSSEGKESDKLKNYLKESFKAIRKTFADVVNFSETTLGLSIQTDARNKVTDNERIILMSSDTRDIIVHDNYGYIVDKTYPKYTIKKYNTNGDADDMTKWKFISKQLATKESLANIVK